VPWLLSDTVKSGPLSPKMTRYIFQKSKSNFSQERVCSTINAAFIGGMGLYLLVINDLFDDPWESFPVQLEIMYPVFMGYCLYDMVTMFYQTQHWSMWVHHIMGVSGSFFMMWGRTGAYYTVWFMITELTAIFDNMNWYFKTLYMPDIEPESKRKWDKFLAVCRATSFVITRLPIGPYSLYKSTFKFKDDIGLLNQWMSLPLTISIPGSLLILLFSFLNTAWTLVLIKKAFDKFRKKRID
jgi:hypothetical protein